MLMHFHLRHSDESMDQVKILYFLDTRNLRALTNILCLIAGEHLCWYVFHIRAFCVNGAYRP